MNAADLTPPRLIRLALPDGGPDDFIMAEVTAGDGPPLVFLSGYGSDMQGTKASWLQQRCAAANWSFIRFDYRNRGQSGGEPTLGTLSRHLADLETVIDQLADRPVILIGSSMGGWLMLDYVKRHPDKVAALLGIAVAPDFTTYLDNDPDEYVAPNFIEDATAHLLGNEPIAFTGPAAFLHGQGDDVVLCEQSVRAAAQLTSAAVTVTLVKDGDHNLSRPQDLDLLWSALTRLRSEVTDTSGTAA